MQTNFKIAYLSLAAPLREEEFKLGEILAAKYGTDRIAHAILPNNFIAEKEQIINTTAKFALDKDVKILLFPQAIPGANAGVDKFKEVRDDVFIIYGFIHEPVQESVKRANLILRTNEDGVGEAIVKQAKKQGAKTFVHYSFPRHMSIATLSGRREIIRKTCEEEGLLFVDANAQDPTEADNLQKARQLLFEDVQKMAEKYGKDTAFFCTNCQLQEALIKAVIETRAIYPQPCCPSPFHSFPEALGIDNKDYDLHHLISEASRILEEKNLSDRFSTWPVSITMLTVNAGVEYAIKWLNGEVSKTGIDHKVLLQCMDRYITDVVGEESHVSLSALTRDGVTYDNYKRILMSYLDL